MSELVKSALLFWAPGPGYVASETIEWLADLAEVFDEAAVEVCKTSKLANIRGILWSGPFGNCLDLDRIHADLVLGDDNSQVLHLWAFKLAFLRFQE